MSKDTNTSASPGVSLTDPGHLLALGLGAGLMPKAPGTWGSLLAIPVYLVLHPYGQAVSIAWVLLLWAAGVYLAGRTARALGVHDHGAIVIDEVVGLLVTLVAVEPGWFGIAAGFLLFRFFDIVKPYPIKRIDQGLGGGMGIMLDDVVAGIMAAVVLQGLFYLAALLLGGA